MEWSCQRSISNLVSNNHGGNPDNGQSTSGFLAKIRTGAISWASKLQNFVMLATMEAEFMAAMLAGTEIIWLHTLNLVHQSANHLSSILITSPLSLWPRIRSIMDG